MIEVKGQICHQFGDFVTDLFARVYTFTSQNFSFSSQYCASTVFEFRKSPLVLNNIQVVLMYVLSSTEELCIEKEHMWLVPNQ